MLASLALALALAAPTASREPNLAAPLDVSLRATYAPAAVKAIADKSGLRLSVDRALARELLVIDVRQTPVETLLSHIAKVTAAEWQRQGDALILRRPEATVRALQAQEEAHVLKALLASVEKSKKEHEGRPVMDAAAAQTAAQDADRLARQWEMVAADPTGDRASQLWNQFAAIQSRNPVNGVLPSIVSGLDMAAMLKFAPGTGVVFSSSPTRVQRAFPAAALPAVRSLLAQLRTWHDVVDANPSGQIAGLPPSGPPTTVLVFAQMSDRGPGYARMWFQLQLLDANGRAVGGTDALSVDTFSGEPGAEQPEPPQDAAPPTPFSEEVAPYAQLAFSRVPREGMSDGSGLKATPAQVAFLVKADAHPFASLMVTDVLRAEAARRGTGLVANVPQDRTLELGVTQEGKAFMLPVALDEVLESDFELTEADGTALVAPRWPVGTSAERWDPVAEGKLLAAVAAGTYLTLDAAAEIAHQLGDQLWLIPSLELLIDPNEENIPAFSAIGQSPWLLEFFRTLNLNQRRGLDAGRRLSGSELSAPQRTAISTRLFNTGTPTPLVGLEAAGPDVDYGAAQTAIIFRNILGDTSLWSGLSTEATLVLGAGLPPGTEVSVQSQTNDLIFAYWDGREGAVGQAMDYGELGFLLAARDNGTPLDRPVPSRFRLGSSTTYLFEFAFPGGFSFSESLSDVQEDTQGAPVAYDQLPDEVRQRIDQVRRDQEPPPPPRG